MSDRGWGWRGAGVLTCLCVMFDTAAAQKSLEFSVDPLIAFPAGEFRNNVPENGIGASVSLAAPIGGTPFMIGGELGFLVYGYESRKEPFSVADPDFRVRQTTWNNIMQAHLFLRWLSARENVRFFFEGLVGFKYFFTDSHLVDVGYAEGYPIGKTTNLSDHAFSYGLGAGLSLRLRRQREESEVNGKRRKERSGLLLELGARYLAGSRADYLRKGSIERVGEEVTWTADHSRTSIVVPFIGIRWEF